MNLKVSLFNKSIFKTDMKRFWIASLLYAVMLFFLVPFQYVAGQNRFLNVINTIPDEYLMTSFAGSTYPAIFLGMLCGGIFALMIFMYINSTPAISFYHSLPYRRTTIYFTKLLSGCILLVLPILINLFVLVSAKASSTFIPAYFEHLFIWAYIQLVYTLIVFLGVSFVAMFTGNFMYLIAVSGICVITPLLTITFTENLLSEHLYGYIGAFENVLYWFYLTPNHLLSLRALIYLALATLFIILGCIIYNKRDLEKNGEAIVFNKAKVFFLYLVAFLCGIFSYWYFSSLLGKTILWMLPFGIFGIMGANMINKKQVTLKGFLKPALIYAVAVVIIFLGFKFDITGFEKRLPKAADVQEVYVEVPLFEHNYSLRDMSYSYREYYDKRFSNLSIKDADEIEKVIALHQYKTENRELKNQSEFFVNFNYKLKNGKTLKRGYNIYKYDGDGLAEDVFMLENMKDRRYHPYKDQTIKYSHITISHDFTGDIASYFVGSEEFEELKNALCEDIKNVPYEYDSTLNNIYYGSKDMRVEIVFEAELPDNTVKTLAPNDLTTTERKPSVMYRYTISDGYPRTKAVLEKFGVYDAIPKTEEIERMYIRHYGEKISENEITSREDIEELYEIALTFDSFKEPYAEKLINIELHTETNGFEISLPVSAVSHITDKYFKLP